MTQDHPIPYDAVIQLAETFRLMGDPNRLRIVLTCLEQPITVGDMAQRLGLSPSLVSHHLRLLRAARLLKGVRDGKHVYYQTADDHVKSVLVNMVDHVLGDCGYSTLDLDAP